MNAVRPTQGRSAVGRGTGLTVPEILWEDEHLLAVNKPAGLLTAPDRWDKSKENLMRLLVGSGRWPYIANVHRLDRDTSGVILMAKSLEILRQLVRQFADRQVEKWYVALCHGNLRNDSMRIDLPLSHDPAHPGLAVIDRRRGKPAQTTLQVLESFRGYTLVRAIPATGRHHQIRVHCAAIGHPLVGDDAYGGCPLLLSTLKPGYKLKRGASERPLVSRVALHAERLQLRHPHTGEPVVLVAPWPKDLVIAVRYLRKYAQRSPARGTP